MASHDYVYCVFVDEKTHTFFMIVWSSTVVQFVTIICSDFAYVYPVHFAKAQDVPTVSVHFMQQFFKSSILPYFSDTPRAGNDFISGTKSVFWNSFGISSTFVTSVLMYDSRDGPC